MLKLSRSSHRSTTSTSIATHGSKKVNGRIAPRVDLGEYKKFQIIMRHYFSGCKRFITKYVVASLINEKLVKQWKQIGII